MEFMMKPEILRDKTNDNNFDNNFIIEEEDYIETQLLSSKKYFIFFWKSCSSFVKCIIEWQYNVVVTVKNKSRTPYECQGRWQW